MKIQDVARVVAERGVVRWPDGYLSAALALLEGWGGIRGLEGRDPVKWDLTQASLVELNWIIITVFRDLGHEIRAEVMGTETRYD